MTLKKARRLFLSYGYSPSEYGETVRNFGGHARILIYQDGLIVQEPGYIRFIHYPIKTTLRPPTNAEFIFYLFLDTQNCDALVGDLEERYRLTRKKFGKRRADFWYWTQAFRSVGPIAWAWLKKVLLTPAVAVVAWAVAKGLLGHDSWLVGILEWYRRIS